MSNTAPNDTGSGQRRRRSRGGKGRNNNNRNRQNQDGGENRSRNQGDRGQRRERGGQGPSQGGGRTRSRRPEPVQLTWWQKLLKAVGLYKAPERPKRAPREVKTNTRVAYTETPDRAADDSPSEDSRPPRKQRSGGRERRERGGRGRDREPERDTPDAEGVESSRLYLGNLSYDVTESDLEELFKGVGPVRRAEIVYNRQTHRSKGYGFIDMLSVDEAKRAVEILHDQFFMGRKLVVSGAKSQGPADDDSDETVESSADPAPAEQGSSEVQDEVGHTAEDLAEGSDESRPPAS